MTRASVPVELARELRKVSRRLDTINKERATLTDRRRALLEKGRVAGVSITEMAQVAGMRRESASRRAKEARS